MAGRTGAGVGVVATISGLAVTTFGLFVGTIVLWGQYSDTLTALKQAEQDNRDYIRPDERQIERIRELRSEAGSDSLVRYLVDTQGDLMGDVTGFPEDLYGDFQTKSASLLVGVGDQSQTLEEALAAHGSLFGVLQDLRRQAQALEDRASDAEAARDDAQGELESQIAEFEDFRQSQLVAARQLQEQVDRLQQDASQYREGIKFQEQVYAQRLEDFERQASEVQESLRSQIETLERKVLVLEDTVSRFREDALPDTLRPLPEEALVDGTVVGVNAADREAFLSLGRGDNIVLGMRFTVYADPTQIRPNTQGEYPPGKATLEIISISEDSSRARILTEARGNPVVVGDVLANAVYDPDKVYKFLVVGNFATGGNPIATPRGTEEIRNLIEEWGGVVIDDLAGDLDMLIVGERPNIPPQPPVDASIEIFEEFRRFERKAQRYDELLQDARATSIPVLNQNRLYTLIGGAPARTR